MKIELFPFLSESGSRLIVWFIVTPVLTLAGARTSDDWLSSPIFMLFEKITKLLVVTLPWERVLEGNHRIGILQYLFQPKNAKELLLFPTPDSGGPLGSNSILILCLSGAMLMQLLDHEKIVVSATLPGFTFVILVHLHPFLNSWSNETLFQFRHHQTLSLNTIQ